MAGGVVGLLVAVWGAGDVWRYLEHPEWQGMVAQQHLVEIGQYLRGRTERYDRVCIDAPGVFGHLYIAAFSGMSPMAYQCAVREGSVTRDGWEKFARFGKFHFVSAAQARADWEAAGQTERWLVLSTVAWPRELVPTLSATVLAGPGGQGRR